MATTDEVVKDFIAAIEHKDVDTALGLVTDDVIYDNVPITPIVGRDAMGETLRAFLAPASEVEWRILRQVTVDDVVVNERLDRFRLEGGWLELPVAGFFEIAEDGRIRRWRDYFDMATYTRQLTELTKQT